MASFTEMSAGEVEVWKSLSEYFERARLPRQLGQSDYDDQETPYVNCGEDAELTPYTPEPHPPVPDQPTASDPQTPSPFPGNTLPTLEVQPLLPIGQNAEGPAVTEEAVIVEARREDDGEGNHVPEPEVGNDLGPAAPTLRSPLVDLGLEETAESEFLKLCKSRFSGASFRAWGATKCEVVVYKTQAALENNNKRLKVTCSWGDLLVHLGVVLPESQLGTTYVQVSHTQIAQTDRDLYDSQLVKFFADCADGAQVQELLRELRHRARNSKSCGNLRDKKRSKKTKSEEKFTKIETLLIAAQDALVSETPAMAGQMVQKALEGVRALRMGDYDAHAKTSTEF